MKPTTANVLLLLMGAIWGLGFAAQQTAMQDIGPILFVCLRFLLAGLAALPIAFFEQRQTPTRMTKDDLSQFLSLGGVFFLALSIQQVGLLGTTITNAGFLTTLYVLLVPTLSCLVFGERPSTLVWPAALCSLVGVFLLSAGDLGNLAWGDGLVLGGAVLWAIHVILVGRTSQQTGLPFTTACAQFLICAFLGAIVHSSLVIAGWEDSWLDLAGVLRAGPEILYAGLISGGLAFTLQAVAQRHTSPSLAVILMSTESLFAALVGMLLLGESLPFIGYLGGLLIVVSVVVVQLLTIRADDEKEQTPGQQRLATSQRESRESGRRD